MNWSSLSRILSIVMLSLGLVLTGCGGGSSAGDSSSSSSVAAKTTVSLTGVVVKGASSARVIGSRNLRAAAGVYPKAMVLAIDKDGNTDTATADNGGAFTLDVESGKDYAIVFFDSGLNVLGSLVKSTDGSSVGVGSDTDTDLGDISIDRKAGKATSSKESTITLKPAPISDADGDGKITMNDADAAKANAIVNNAAAVTTVNTLSAFGTKGVWYSVIEDWMDPTTGYSGTDKSIRVFGNVKRVGPNGTMVDALKSATVQYHSVSKDPYGNLMTSGYFSNVIGWVTYDGQTSSKPPVKYDMFNGPWARADYTSADPYTNFITQDNGDGSGWTKLIPLEVTLGKTYTVEGSVQGLPVTQSIVVNLAKGVDGKPYMYNDSLGLMKGVAKLPVMDVTVDVSDMYSNPLRAMHLYIISNYGVQIGAEDALGNVIPVADALDSLAFGLIDQYGNIKQANATGIDLPKGTRDAWIKYANDNMAQIGVFDAQASSAVGSAVVAQDYFYMDWNSGTVVSPSSWNPITYLSNVLTAGQAQNFDANVSYMTSTGVDFKYEFRAWDMATMQSTVIGTSSSAAITMGPTNSEALAVVSGVVSVPAIADIPADAVWSYFDPTANKNVSGAWVELWLMMVDANGVVSAQFVESYEVQDAAQFSPAVGGGVAASVQMDWMSLNPGVTPASWNAVTFMPEYLTPGVTQDFYADITYDTYAAASLQYEFRVWDWASNTYKKVGAASTTTTVAATFGATSTRLAGSFAALPLMGDVPADTQWTYLDPLMMSNVTEAWVELWAVMVDGAGVEIASSMLEGYTLREVAPGATTFGYAWVNADSYGFNVSPASFNAITYQSVSLTGGSPATFTSNVTYYSSQGLNVTFELRGWDSNWMTQNTIASSAGVPLSLVAVDTTTNVSGTLTAVPTQAEILATAGTANDVSGAISQYTNWKTGLLVTDTWLDLYMVVTEGAAPNAVVIADVWLDSYAIQ